MNPDGDTLTARIAMSMLSGMDATVADRLLEALGTPEAVMSASEAELKAIGDIPKSIIPIQKRYQATERARAEMEFLNNTTIRPIWYRDEDFPRRLLNASRPPLVIYTLGNVDLNASRTVGIVGTRHATAYGNAVTEQLVNDLAARVDNIVTVSGLAYGIDVAAHRASLAAGIPTVGVLGHGLNRIYPAVHRDVAGRMVRQGGMLLSDYDHEANVNGYNFLARNRLIAALSDILVVVESGEQGGALATARLAAKCGSRVAAVPGRVTDVYSAGCNRLIATGQATAITSADDLIELMGWPRKNTQPATDKISVLPDLTSDERTLLHHIMTTPGCDNDMLASASGMSAARIMTVMIGLEMKNVVTLQPGNRYEVIQTIDPASLLQ